MGEPQNTYYWWTNLKEDVSRDKVIIDEVDEVVGVLDVWDDVVGGGLGAVETGPVGPPQHEGLVLKEGRHHQ